MPVLVSVAQYKGDTPFPDVNAFADKYQHVWDGNGTVVRSGATHPSGPAVILQARVRYPNNAIARQVDALFVRDGLASVLSMRAPVDSWSRYASAFDQIFQRFIP